MLGLPRLTRYPLLLLLALTWLAAGWKPAAGPLWEMNFPQGVSSVAFSPDGQALAVCTRAQDVLLFEARTGRQLRQLKAPGDCFQLAFSSDGRRLTARGWAALTQHDLVDGRDFWLAGPLAAAGVSADGRWIVTGENIADRGGRCEDYFLTLYDHGKKVWSDHGEDVCVDSLQLNPQGDRWLAQWRNRRVLRGWSLGTNDGGEVSLGTGECRLGPGGERIAHWKDEKLRLLDGRTGRQLVAPVAADGCPRLAFSPDGSRVVGSGRSLAMGIARSYSSTDLDAQGEVRFEGNVLTSKFVDDYRVLSTTSQGRFLVWDARNGHLVREPDTATTEYLGVWDTHRSGLIALGGFKWASPQPGWLKVYSVP